MIRQSTSAEVHDLEVRIYTQVLPKLSVKTPSFLVAFDLGTECPNWMVLEKLDGEEASGGTRTERRRILETLARLHLEGIVLERSGQLADANLPRFDAEAARYQKWRSILVDGIADGSYSLLPWIPSCLDAVLAALPGFPYGLIHSDLDLSNIIVAGNGTIGLIDWEKACIGPISVDLGQFMEHVASGDELQGYCRQLVVSQGLRVSEDDVSYWADVGRAFKLIHEICSYVHASLKGRAPAPSWRGKYFEPCLPALEAIAKRNRWCD